MDRDVRVTVFRDRDEQYRVPAVGTRLEKRAGVR
jgi:hypothetical protein